MVLDKGACARTIERLVRTDTYPIAVRMLRDSDEVPRCAKRPMQDFGHHLSLCQGLSMSRRGGESLVFLKEDMWCPEPVIGLGFEKAPQFFLEGHNRFPHDVKTLEAGSNFARSFPKLPLGKYRGVECAPLAQAKFGPDVIVIYCTPAQLTLLLLGAAYTDGHDFSCTLSGHAACVFSIVPPMLTGKYQVAVPCRGDRTAAGAQDSEMIFSVPWKRVADLVAGLQHIEETGSKLPAALRMQPEYELPESYVTMAREMGMKI